MQQGDGTGRQGDWRRIRRSGPELCPRCNLPYPRGWATPQCPRCGADASVEVRPRTWWAVVMPAFCGLLAGMPLGANLVQVLAGEGAPPQGVIVAALAVGGLLAVVMGWLSRHLVPSVMPGLSRLALAMLTVGFLALLGGAAAEDVARSGGELSEWARPGGLLVLQVAGTAALYLLLHRGLR